MQRRFSHSHLTTDHPESDFRRWAPLSADGYDLHAPDEEEKENCNDFVVCYWSFVRSLPHALYLLAADNH